MRDLDLSNGNRTKTRLQTVIRLLTLLAGAGAPVSSDKTWLPSDIAVMEELETGGYISAGDVARGEQGQVVGIVGMRINPRGRAYLSELQKQAAADSSVGFIKNHRFSFYKRVFGIVGTVVAGLIFWFISHH
jgi:hypothetical protein